ncbi:hypothetical protein NDU88_004530 [Pleurodeles waltl]|uniref:Uncharacterized protein n=1 Tax=Pleurodeles waltl TaxID=8319 RepID=A0AAV7M8G7_PLEWA|nr:hypothetical protein NDU88_004530 [Pleurodeles waltl]
MLLGQGHELWCCHAERSVREFEAGRLQKAAGWVRQLQFGGCFRAIKVSVITAGVVEHGEVMEAHCGMAEVCTNLGEGARMRESVSSPSVVGLVVGFCCARTRVQGLHMGGSEYR